MQYAEKRPFYPDLLGTLASARLREKSPRRFLKPIRNPQEIEASIQEYFRNRALVREDSARHDIPIPFSMVLEAELEQIQIVREQKQVLDKAPTGSP